VAAIIHHLLVLFLIVIFPLWDRVETKRLKASTDPRDRIHAYRMTIGWQVIACAMILATVPLAELITPPAHDRIFGAEVKPHVVLPIVGGLLLGAMIPILVTLVKPEAREKQMVALQSIEFFLPCTPQARRWWAALSIVVGVAEEIIFRGFLIRYMLALPIGWGVGGAVIAAAVVFGIDHGYQGIAGLISTTILALVFSALFFASGSLWLPMLVHALIDMRILLLVRPGGEARQAEP
jgi:membrane protease YdiL (CAAX protease family)